MTPNEPDLYKQFKNPNLKTCGCCGEWKVVQKEGDGVICRECMLEIETDIANTTVLGHLLHIPLCIFDFKFLSALGSLIYAIQRAFSIGSYHPVTGEFYTRRLISKSKD